MYDVINSTPCRKGAHKSADVDMGFILSGIFSAEDTANKPSSALSSRG